MTEEEMKQYKFYKYDNNPNGSDYCFCQRPVDSNMSLCCFLENGEIYGFMSETLVYKYPNIKEIDMNDFMFYFVKPLLKENQQLKQQLQQRDNILKDLIKRSEYEIDFSENGFGINDYYVNNISKILNIDKGDE